MSATECLSLENWVESEWAHIRILVGTVWLLSW